MLRHRFAWPVALSPLLVGAWQDLAFAQDGVAGAPTAEETPSETPSAPPDAAGEIDPDAVAKEEAKKLFLRGLELFNQQAYDAALVEFAASREAYENKSAVRNAALSLWRLQRFDEAVETFEELLLLPTASEDEKSEARKYIADLAKLIAYVAIAGEDGTIIVDGRERGELPLLQPLRVGAGTHSLRVERRGYAPFETRLALRGGQRKQVSPTFTSLGEFGVLVVKEQTDNPATVFIDGVNRGKTPFSGRISPGDHTVYLVGADDTGTAPVRVNVKQHQDNEIALHLESLPSSLNIDINPRSGRVFVDGVPVGEGPWAGRLHAGEHTIGVELAGYYPIEESVKLEVGDSRELSLTLRPTVVVEKEEPGDFTLEVALGAAFVPSLGGVLDKNCAQGDCSTGVGLGFDGRLLGGYQFASGVSIGVLAGFWSVSQSTENQPSTLQPIGRPTNQGTLDDSVRIAGIRLGGWGGATFGSDWIGQARVAASLVIGSVRDERTGSFVSSTGQDYTTGTVSDDDGVLLLVLEPELRTGFQLGESSLLTVGVALPIAYTIDDPQWTDTDPLPAGNDGLARYEEEPLLGSWTLGIAPSLAWRVLL